jgi:hypothetical protein
MIEGEDTLFDQLGALPIADLRRQLEVGCRRLFLRVCNQDIAEQRFDHTRSAPSASDDQKWRHVLRNSLVTVWNDSQNDQIVDSDVLLEEVLGIAEAIEHSGYNTDQAISLISEFLAEDPR